MNLGNYFRLRELIHGERASRSIVNRTTAAWSSWMVASLILADPGGRLESDATPRRPPELHLTHDLDPHVGGQLLDDVEVDVRAVDASERGRLR